MIANIGRGENLFGALAYNQLKVDKENGQILYTHKMVETPDGSYSVAQLARSFEPYLLANNKTEKPILHISLNPNPKDNVSDEKFQAIAQDYMEQMGYGNQPFVVFKHTDTSRTHIHIVSVCVDEEGRKISDTFDKRRSVNITRALEQKYGLIPTIEKENSQKDNIFRPVDYKKGDIKSQIASVVRYLPTYYRFQSLGEYNALLSLFNITAEEVKGELHGVQKQGLIYSALNENGEKIGNPFKASLFGKNAGYKMLQEHFLTSKESFKQEPAKVLWENSIEVAMHTATDEISFKKQLQQQGINTVIRRNSEGRLYGITFIDHNSKTVWNGSRLGKKFSANIFNDWWTRDQKPEISTTESKKTGHTPFISPDVNQEQMQHSLFDFLGDNKNESVFIEGFGGLLPQVLGEDYEELAFENQMKKKRKRKKD
ncbi:relaxase/mobilization nuclease domain-containing protein [Chryseobacterium herbae]|uniref:Relaxase/mobilization nuclease domain-containing protein n=1 Tax=Chryseobacterium herbae TaxID=2976476 RepID=A0ABT2IT01_9FLAO|nr:relaxase/mobilization nuclease domain-containing protein [Chryseobacterium sp. pc1-10]MCT2561785.1 relaxase/mobilization nuclease domain-containing protein [Chryseobacterium sp. pc1-10]